uniref:Pco135291a n=1 Tax=Arundo donax TaxID=35708 RepID=A0A0A9DKG7_ARUDO
MLSSVLIAAFVNGDLGDGFRMMKDDMRAASWASVYPWESEATRTASLKSSVLSRTLDIAEGVAAAASSYQIRGYSGASEMRQSHVC